jgi:hypothetical protein
MRRRRSSLRERLLIRIIITMIGKAFLGGGKEKTSEGDEGAQKRPRRPRLLLFPMLRTMTTKTQMN